MAAPPVARPVPAAMPAAPERRRRGELPDDIFLVPPEETPILYGEGDVGTAMRAGREQSVSTPNLAGEYKPQGYVGRFDPRASDPDARGPGSRAGVPMPGKGETRPFVPDVAERTDLSEAATDPRIQAQADTILQRQGVKESLRAAHGDSDSFISNRASQLEAADVRLADAEGREPLSTDAARELALQELAHLRTVGLWSSSIFAPGIGNEYLGAAAPRVEILGVKRGAPLPTPGSGKSALTGYIYRVQGPGSYAIDLISAPIYAATATGVPDVLARAAFGKEREAPERPAFSGETARRAIAERRTFSDVAAETAPTTVPGRLAVAGLGAAADILMPDPISFGRGAIGGVKAVADLVPAMRRMAAGGAAARSAASTADDALGAAARVLDAPRPTGGSGLDEALTTATRVDEAMAKLGDSPLARTVKMDAARRAAARFEDAGLPDEVIEMLRAGPATATRAAVETAASPTGALRNLVEHYIPPGRRGTAGTQINIPHADVIATATEAAAREALQEARLVVASVGKAAPVETRSVMRELARMRGVAVGDVEKTVGKAGLPVSNLELFLMESSSAGALAKTVRGNTIPMDIVARMDNALEETALSVARAGEGTLTQLTAQTPGLIRAAVNTAADAAKIAVVGVDNLKLFTRESGGLGAAAYEGTKRIARAMDAAAAGVARELAKGPVTTDAAEAALARVPMPENTAVMAATTPDSVVRALYSDEAIAKHLEELAPGSGAYARGVGAGTVMDDTDIGKHIMFNVPVLLRLPPQARTTVNIKAVAMWVGAHGGAAHPLLELYGAGVLLTRQEARALSNVDDVAALAKGGPVFPSVRPQVLAEVASHGLPQGAVAEGLFQGVSPQKLTMFYDSPWVPKAVRDAIADSASAIMRKEATVPNLSLEAARSLWSRGVTRGLLAPRPGYLLNNTFGNIEQVLIEHGAGVALKYSIRAELQSILATAGAGGAQLLTRTAGAGVGSALNVGISAAAGTRVGKAVVDAVLNGITRGGELAARLVGTTSRYPSIGKILDAGDGTVTLAGRVYRYKDLYNAAARGGVMDSFDAADLGETASSLLKFLPAEGVQHFAEAVSLRQRVGLYATLIDNGATPNEAAAGVVKALYDYRHTLTPAEKGVVRWMLPFWTWQKNAQKQFFGAINSPAACYRLTSYIKARRAITDLSDQFAASDYDYSGVAVGRLPHGGPEAYARATEWLDRKGIPAGEERNRYILNWDYTVGGVDATMEELEQLNEDLLYVQEYTQPIAWRANLPSYRRNAAAARVPGSADRLAWAVPPSGMEAAINYTAALLAVMGATGEGAVGLATGTQSSRAIDVFTENVIDPERMPLSTAFVRERVTVSDSLGSLVDSLSPFGFSGAERVKRSEVDDAGNLTGEYVWVVQGPGSIFMLDVTGLLAYDRQLKRVQPGALGGESNILPLLSASGVQFFAIDGGADFEWSAADRRAKKVLQRDLATEVIDQAATEGEE